MPKHNYYSEYKDQRKAYFDGKFLENARAYAQGQGITFQEFLSTIKDFPSFKRALKRAFSEDASLESYFEGMDDREILEFFNRPVIQNILNLEIEDVVEDAPDKIVQEDKKNIEVFLSEVVSKMTGKKKKVFAKKEFVKVQGKKQVRFRDSKGRFVKRI